MFHLHNRAFMLRFARDRNAYRAKLREQLSRYDLWLLDCRLTLNHVHLLVDAEDRLEVSRRMREVVREFARAYHRRKGRSNAVWGDNFHARLVEGAFTYGGALRSWASGNDIDCWTGAVMLGIGDGGSWGGPEKLRGEPGRGVGARPSA